MAQVHRSTEGDIPNIHLRVSNPRTNKVDARPHHADDFARHIPMTKMTSTV